MLIVAGNIYRYGMVTKIYLNRALRLHRRRNHTLVLYVMRRLLTQNLEYSGVRYRFWVALHMQKPIRSIQAFISRKLTYTPEESLKNLQKIARMTYVIAYTNHKMMCGYQEMWISNVMNLSKIERRMLNGSTTNLVYELEGDVVFRSQRGLSYYRLTKQQAEQKLIRRIAVCRERHRFTKPSLWRLFQKPRCMSLLTALERSILKILTLMVPTGVEVIRQRCCTLLL